MTEAVVFMAAFVVFLTVALVLALRHQYDARKPRVRLQLDPKTGEYLWVEPDGTTHTLESYRGLLQNRGCGD